MTSHAWAEQHRRFSTRDLTFGQTTTTRFDFTSFISSPIRSHLFVVCRSRRLRCVFISHPTNLTCLRHHKSMILIWLRAHNITSGTAFHPTGLTTPNRKFHWSLFLPSFWENTLFPSSSKLGLVFGIIISHRCGTCGQQQSSLISVRCLAIATATREHFLCNE